MNSEILDGMGLGDVDAFYLFLTLGIIILLLLIFVIVETISVINLKKRFRVFMSGRNAMSLESGIAGIYKDITMLKEHDIRFRSDIKEIKVNLLDCYQKVGLVKYDAFREMGGQLSFSIALLDKQDNGFILNSVHSANGCYTYTKEIQNGVSAIDLADEEKEALNRAMRVDAGAGYIPPATDMNGQAYSRQNTMYGAQQQNYENYAQGRQQYYDNGGAYEDTEQYQDYYENEPVNMNGQDMNYNA